MDKQQENEAMRQGGSGSSEQTGSSRQEQSAQHTALGQEQRNEAARQAGLDPDQIADLNDLGTTSGRDDLAGGSGDRMETQSGGEATDRPE